MRPVKLEFYDHSFTCPFCKQEITYTSMLVVIVSSRRNCPSCKGEVMITDGKISAATERKPPHRTNRKK